MIITSDKDRILSNNLALRWLYNVTFIVLAFTGFGQMPIFKRYYISDIPGMGWTADFYFTHYIHYLGATILLALFAYVSADFLLLGKKKTKLTTSAHVRILILIGVVATGVLRVMKNLPDVVFSPGFTLFIDIGHLGFVMMYFLVALFCLILKSGWVERKSR
ncbi:MAG: hypothetical protein BBJ60_11640 [Desulfobacterales bacterium S7086C20]|nr:MAG: hypothetical protein BBJ60_11640 [Desulfobacterales bacterium S7086C20]